MKNTQSKADEALLQNLRICCSCYIVSDEDDWWFMRGNVSIPSHTIVAQGLCPACASKMNMKHLQEMKLFFKK